MGCKGSKLDDQEAVALCRARAELLAAAVRHRYALADAHAALADSIESVAAPLHRLLRLQQAAESPPGLTLPSARKGGGGAPASRLPRSFDTSSAHAHSSRLQFGASPGSEPASSPAEADSPPRRVPEQLQQPHPHPHYAAYGYEYDYATQPAYAYPAPAGSLQFYYARSRPPPASVAVTQRAPGPPERVRFGSFDAPGGYPQHHYAYSAQRAPAPPPAALQRAAPPSPPKASSWDFLNVFENYDSYDSYYYDSATAAAAAAAPYTPSRSSREVREEEGIPDLEDDDDEDSLVVKEVAGQYSAPGSGGARSRRSSLGGVSSTAELDQPENVIAHKDVIGELRRRPTAHGNVSVHAPPPPARRAVDNANVAGEIKAQLVRTAEAARQLAPMLEVGRPSYQGRSSVYQCELHLVYFMSNLTSIVSYSLCHWMLNFLISFLEDDVGYLRSSFGVQRHGRVGRRSGREDGGHAEPILGT